MIKCLHIYIYVYTYLALSTKIVWKSFKSILADLGLKTEQPDDAFWIPSPNGNNGRFVRPRNRSSHQEGDKSDARDMLQYSSDSFSDSF